MTETPIENLINNLLQDRNLQGYSEKWANWESQLLPTSCRYCVEQHGKIFDISILDNKTEIQAHPNCKCVYVSMRTKLVGTATDLGIDGVDMFIADYGYLPEYYVNKETAYKAGWKTIKKNLSAVLPGKVIGGDIYGNKNSKLPSSPGRIWYEADINYTSGKRNRQRIVYSNDGLMFATYDHFQTFYEIIG